jgi:IclR family acetate operon transcriptional repressor
MLQECESVHPDPNARGLSPIESTIVIAELITGILVLRLAARLFRYAPATESDPGEEPQSAEEGGIAAGKDATLLRKGIQAQRQELGRCWPLRRCSGRCVFIPLLLSPWQVNHNIVLMQKPPVSRSARKPVQKRPTYLIEAVDNALRLLQLLRDGGALRLKDAAAELGVAPSTAHRLLAMLVYRGFAVQDETRRYVPGPAMGVGPAGLSWTRLLRTLAQPHMELLSGQLNETVNLMVRVGTKVRILATVEGNNVLRVGDRQGTVMPANKASGGKAMLAELGLPMIEQLFRSRNAEIGGDTIPDSEYPAFLRELKACHNNGFAANFEGIEEGVSTLGIALHNSRGQVVGALSVATPATRFRDLFDAGLVAALRETCRQLEIDIAANPAEPE